MLIRTIISIFFILHASNLAAQNFQKIIINDQDSLGGYYLALKPWNEIHGVLVLFPTKGHPPETIFEESKIQNIAWSNSILTVAASAGKSFYADKESVNTINFVLNDVIKRFNVKADQFVIGGFGGGGMIGLRYVEYCIEQPDRFPIQPKAVFAVDPAVDLISLSRYFQRELEHGISEIGKTEAKMVLEEMNSVFGALDNNNETLKELTPFNVNLESIGNEQFLEDIPIRLYYDVDLIWALDIKRRSAYDLNFLNGSELIKRLLVRGNEQAEFIQATGKGFRSNGQRHPHSWSIVDEVECVQWIKNLIE